jgi:glycosyltransferase involved in cell wall biosynthesis
MKVAYLVSQYPAPSHTFVRREVEALRRAGVEVHTFSVRAPAAEERESVDRGELERTFFLLERRRELARAHLRAVRTRPRRYARTLGDALRHRVPGARAALWSLFHFAEAISLAHELERRGVEHLHNHFANSGATVGYLASRHLDLPFSLMLHGSSEFDYPAGPILELKIAHADFVACASHYVRSQAMRGVDPALWSKMFLVRCAVELERCPARRERPEGGPVRVLHVGRLSPEKGQLGLLEAFRGVLDGGVDAELRVIGDGPSRAVVERRAEALGLGDRCVFLGRMREEAVLSEMAEADVFAMSSFMEGLPVVLMEAMAVGLPVVAPSVAGIPELVEPERTGLLFPTGDVEALGRALARLCADEPLRRRLAAAGEARVRAEFVMPIAAAPLVARLRSAHRARDAAGALARDLPSAAAE